MRIVQRRKRRIRVRGTARSMHNHILNDSVIRMQAVTESKLPIDRLGLHLATAGRMSQWMWAEAGSIEKVEGLAAKRQVGLERTDRMARVMCGECDLGLKVSYDAGKLEEGEGRMLTLEDSQ
ncbi:unnamed protein product [Rhizoctonia solani]|uniref:Uncharacterized protein n=1 Tax=Rhizoctonia solani TaxID=456999 RepID=A0A8H3HYL0_9AGAM|nr:unnamed protein product [Rhizoctonia solani]